MKLATNKINYTVPGKNIKVAVSKNFDRKELSAQSSSTSTASSGDKPAKVKVSLQIPLTERKKYRQLVEIAQAKNSKGDPIIYEIVDNICFDHNILQVIFVGKLSCKEDNSLRCYNVSFCLQEFNSVAEKREQRESHMEEIVEVAGAIGKIITNEDMIKEAKEQLKNRF